MSVFDGIPPEAPAVETGVTSFRLHEGVVFAVANPDSPTRRLADLAGGLGKLLGLLGGTRYPFIFDLRSVGWIEPDARAFVREHIARVATRAAFVVDRSPAGATAYALLGFEEPPIPVGIFTDEERAVAFLREDSGADD